MFASLKNKIREETGNDLSKLTAKISSTTAQRIDAFRGRSQQGSTSSINSIVLSDKDEVADKHEDDYKKRILKLETELAEKSREWQEILNEKDKRLSSLEKEKDDAYKQISSLKESLKYSEGLQKKLIEHREDKAQIENFQSQELSKVKQLVLLREKELADKTASFKEAVQQLDKLKSEVLRLRRQEERLSDLQDDLDSLRHSSSRDISALAADLAKSEQDRKHLSDLVAVLSQRRPSDANGDSTTQQERKILEQRLEEAHLHLADIKTSWSDKIASLETQVGRLSRQAAEESTERRRAVNEKETLLEEVKQLECELECIKLELINKDSKIKRLTCEVEELSKELRNLRNDSDEEIAFMKKQIVS